MASILRYKSGLTAGSLKLAESKIVADLMLKNTDAKGWKEAIVVNNIFQARNPSSAIRIASLIRSRLKLMQPEHWKLVRDGKGVVSAQALFAAAIKHSSLLADFMALVVSDQYKLLSKSLANSLWAKYLEGCRERDPNMPAWSESTVKRLRSSIYQCLAQAGYIDNTKSRTLQTVHISDAVLNYLQAHKENKVLKAMMVEI